MPDNRAAESKAQRNDQMYLIIPIKYFLVDSKHKGKMYVVRKYSNKHFSTNLLHIIAFHVNIQMKGYHSGQNQAIDSSGTVDAPKNGLTSLERSFVLEKWTDFTMIWSLKPLSVDKSSLGVKSPFIAFPLILAPRLLYF